MKIYLLFIPILIAFSCKNTSDTNYYVKNSIIYNIKTNKPFTGVIKGKSEDKFVEYHVKNGIKNGPFIMTLKNGKVVIKGNIDNGSNTGKWEYFYNSGEPESYGIFVDDIPEGIWVWYFPDGKLREIGKYSKGNRDSIWVNYDPSGKVVMKKNFKMGKLLTE